MEKGVSNKRSNSIGTMRGLLLIFILSPYSAIGEDGCKPLQHLEFGVRGEISCSFESGFIRVSWYNTPDSAGEDPVITLRGSEKSGRGYDSGEFDIHPNGVLIINKVSLQHETTFTVTRVSSLTIIEDFKINVKVIKTPEIRSPMINGTVVENGELVFHEVHFNDVLTCEVGVSRPVIPLSWVLKTENDAVDITYQSHLTNESSFYSNSVELTKLFPGDSLLQLFTCLANDSLQLLERNESSILILKKDVDLLEQDAMWHHPKVGSRVVLDCSAGKVDLEVWKKVTTRGDFENLLYSAFEYTKVLAQEVKGNGRGSLVIPNVHFQSEGLYACIYKDDTVDGIALHNLTVIAEPNPPYPVVDGCVQDQYCVLEVALEGSLSCSLTGIRPEVQLEWQEFGNTGLIEFTNQQSKVSKEGETFDITLTTEYKLKSALGENRITIKCVATGHRASLFTLSTKLDLLFNQGTFGTQTGPSSWVWLIVIIILVFIGLCVAIAYVKLCKRKHRKQSTDDKEQGMPMIRTDSETRLKRKFMEEIKGKYEDLYESVMPVPYMKDKRFCVDSIFVESGLTVYTSNHLNKTSEQRPLSSYADMFSKDDAQSKRRIIEGEAGYGKTTLTLQLAYDWCTKKGTSPLKKFELLILLRLRQLGGIKSVYEAIKKFILPRDSQITEENIEDLLRDTHSTLIIFDGYDEYPDKDGNSDISHIIKKEMFQNFEVILTTRSSVLPKDYAPQTKKIALTGFDKKAQKAYLEKVVKGEIDGVDKIQDHLEDNPQLADLCQVPLFFTMFAHIVHEKGKLKIFSSVTSFFRYVVTSLHYHLKYKDDYCDEEGLERFAKHHKALNELAFTTLYDGVNTDGWIMEDICERLGGEFVEHYLKVGIFVQEKRTSVEDKPGTLAPELVKEERKVSFYHNLFCEWYAAHHLAENAPKKKELLDNLDPFNLQYLYRFACGLNKDAATIIIEHLKHIADGDKYTALCILEQSGNLDNIHSHVECLCKNVVQIGQNDVRMLQRCSIQLLTIASTEKINISIVWINGSFKQVGDQSDEIILQHGLHLPLLHTLQELRIEEKGKEFDLDETKGIIEFASKCQQLKTLRFEACLLPFPVPKAYLVDRKATKTQVSWCATGTWYLLNLESGRWQVRDIGVELSNEEYEREVKNFKDFHNW